MDALYKLNFVKFLWIYVYISLFFLKLNIQATDKCIWILINFIFYQKQEDNKKIFFWIKNECFIWIKIQNKTTQKTT